MRGGGESWTGRGRRQALKGASSCPRQFNLSILWNVVLWVSLVPIRCRFVGPLFGFQLGEALWFRGPRPSPSPRPAPSIQNLRPSPARHADSLQRHALVDSCT